MSAVQTDRWSRSYAKCDDCDLLHPESTRVRVRSHVANSGHKVRYVIENTTVYRPAGAS